MEDNKIKSKTILILEDDLFIREFLQEISESEGFDVILAINGSDAFFRLEDAPVPCLVMLDLLMPIMDGRKFMDIFQAQPRYADVPILIISAIATKENSHGASAYLSKPVDIDKLLVLIRQFAS